MSEPPRLLHFRISHFKPQFPYPLPEPRPQALVDLQGRLAERPAWRWVLDMYARHRGASAELTA